MIKQDGTLFLDRKFQNDAASLKQLQEGLRGITYRKQKNKSGEQEIIFNNQEKFVIKQIDGVESLFQGQENKGSLLQKIREFNAKEERQQPENERLEQIHNLLAAQKQELKQFLDSLEKRNSLQNMNQIRTQDQLNQNTIQIQCLQDSLKKIEQLAISQAIQIDDSQSTFKLLTLQIENLENKCIKLHELLTKSHDYQSSLETKLESLEQNQIVNNKQFEERIFNLELTVKEIVGRISNFEQMQNKQLQQLKKEQDVKLVVLQKQIEKQQPKQVQINQFQLQQQNIFKGKLYLTPLQNDPLTELQFTIDDEESEYSIGILREGDLDYLDIKVRAYLFDFPDGTLTRGAEDALRFLPRYILRRDRLGIRVDQDQSKLIVSLNGQDLPPVNLSEDFGPFTFILKSQSQYFELEDNFYLDLYD